MEEESYRCEMASVEEFVRRIERLVRREYYFAFVGHLKPGKDPLALDQKMVRLWNLDRKEWRWAKRSRGSESNVHYVRFRRTYVLLATAGRPEKKGRRPWRRGEIPPRGEFFEQHPNHIDLKDVGLKLFGYNIKSTYSRAHNRRRVFIRLQREKAFPRIKASLLRKATLSRYQQREAMEAAFWHLPILWYGPVREQLSSVLRAVNRIRSRAGLSELRRSRCIRQTILPAKRQDREAKLAS